MNVLVSTFFMMLLSPFGYLCSINIQSIKIYCNNNWADNHRLCTITSKIKKKFIIYGHCSLNQSLARMRASTAGSLSVLLLFHSSFFFNYTCFESWKTEYAYSLGIIQIYCCHSNKSYYFTGTPSIYFIIFFRQQQHKQLIEPILLIKFPFMRIFYQ